MATEIRDRDRGYKNRVGLLERAKEGPPVDIGIFASKGGKDHGSATVLDIAIWNEFGTLTTPQRSFLRSWFDENRDKALDLWILLMRAVVQGKLTREKAMEQFGQWCVGEIQQRIANRIPPPNKQSTIDKKGSDVPLIDTGVLRSSITYRVRK